MNVVEHALHEYLQTEEGARDDTAVVKRAIPVYRGWTGTVYLTIEGQFLFRDEEVDPPEVRVESDEHLHMIAIVEGAERFAILGTFFLLGP